MTAAVYTVDRVPRSWSKGELLLPWVSVSLGKRYGWPVPTILRDGPRRFFFTSHDRVPLIWFPRLWHGVPQEWTHVEIFGDGAALHWPDLDEDLSVPDLIAGRPSGESPESLRDWLESRRKAGKPVRA